MLLDTSRRTYLHRVAASVSTKPGDEKERRRGREGGKGDVRPHCNEIASDLLSALKQIGQVNASLKVSKVEDKRWWERMRAGLERGKS